MAPQAFVDDAPQACSQTLCDCDKLTVHPDDPHKVGKGILWATSAQATAKAITACPVEVYKHPSLRIHYQPGRAFDAAKRMHSDETLVSAYWLFFHLLVSAAF